MLLASSHTVSRPGTQNRGSLDDHVAIRFKPAARNSSGTKYRSHQVTSGLLLHAFVQSSGPGFGQQQSQKQQQQLQQATSSGAGGLGGKGTVDVIEKMLKVSMAMCPT